MASLTQDFSSFEPTQPNRYGTLALIVVAHMALFVLLRSGLLPQVAQTLPQQMLSVFVTPEPVRDTPRPRLHPPKLSLTEPVPRIEPLMLPPTALSTVTDASQAATEPMTSVAAAPLAPPAPARPKLISSGVEYIHPPRPEYPALSRRLGEEGKVVLRILINEKGQPEQVEVEKSSGSSRLDSAACQAALRALFKPHIEDGKPIAVYALVPIGFKLG